MIGIIVDGHGDFASFSQKLCGRCRVLKTDGPRGHEAVPEDIAKAAVKQLNMLAALGCKAAVVVTDFEMRREAYHSFVSRLRHAFAGLNVRLSVSIIVANTMIENWYLADIEFLSKKKKYIKDNIRQRPFEGKHGKRELARLFARGYSYNEVKHGPELFCCIRADVAARNSASFNALAGALPGLLHH